MKDVIRCADGGNLSKQEKEKTLQMKAVDQTCGFWQETFYSCMSYDCGSSHLKFKKHW